MIPINTTLTTSGNSVAVRLPKELLRQSGLTSRVKLEAKKGKIIISKATTAREGWAEQINRLLVTNGAPADDFADMTTAAGNGLDDLPWNGPSFEEWQKDNVRLS